MIELVLYNQNTAALMISLLACVLTVLTKDWHGRFTFDYLNGVQKAHTKATPRVGGVAILLAISCAAPLTDQATRDMLLPTLLASTPAFIFGLAEDLTRRVTAIQRLLATMLSGVFCWYLTGVSLTSVGVPVLDQLLAVGAISVIFTAFAIGGVANAVNLIDGYNGMASGFVMLALLGVTTIASDVGDATLAKTSLLVAAAFLGFFLVNWPFGKLFLGDSGAYLGGFLVAWLWVLLVQRNESVSPFAAFLVCAHPITETLYSLWRRLKSGTDASKPDSMHLHNTICYRLLPLVNGRMEVANSMSGISMACLSIPCAFFAYCHYTSGITCASLSLIFILSYAAIYPPLAKHSHQIPP
jgi:UDP-N-acetylmuramyl pentapeptide phosphotransferase/UDP-N-acetylglucosamine-1-phosphate transferase